MKFNSATSRAPTENLQEMLDANQSAGHTALYGLSQFETPPWFAALMAKALPVAAPAAVFDPQCAGGNLLRATGHNSTARFGCELDRRFRDEPLTSGKITDLPAPITRLTANCVEVYELLAEFFPGVILPCQVANPPFSLTFKTKAGPVDSTLYTWQAMLRAAYLSGCGYMIANRATIERLGLHKDIHAYLYQTFPNGIFPDAKVEIGVLHFHKSHRSGATVVHHQSVNPSAINAELMHGDAFDVASNMQNPHGSTPAALTAAFATIAKIIAEEKRKDASPFNIWLDGRGLLRTYLSTKEQLTRKFSVKEVERLASINHAHPLSLTPEKETRTLLESLVNDGIYTVDPKARDAIRDALASVGELAIPLMPVTDFQRVAYCDEEDSLVARVSTSDTQQVCLDPASGLHVAAPRLTRGKLYPLTTATYEFVNSYERKKLHLGQAGTYAADHSLTLSGQDRFIEITDDYGRRFRFMDRPSPLAKVHTELPDDKLWDFFQKPEVPTVAEKFPERIEQNTRILDAIEMMAGFTYFPGQRPYLARVACLDYGLIGAETGTGKSLMCISLVVLKAPKRALIVAPQGTTRSPKDDDDDQPDMTASQWITELRRFAPGVQVFELFGEDDYERILSVNGGELPHGIFVTYYEAFFQNGAREWDSAKLDDKKLAKETGLTPHGDDQQVIIDGVPHTLGVRSWCDGLGTERNGIRCISRPTLSSKIGHLFDFIGCDEAHKAAHLSSNLTKMLVRLQPRYRYAFTATPIPNLVTDLFPLAGWLCVPEWYKGGRRNAAWPYAREDGGRFSRTFLTTERDLTQELMNKAADPAWKGKVEKVSPVLSSPARLLKLITPWMAYISKKDCNPALPPRLVKDVRVPMGAAQSRLYGHYMERANIPAKDAREAAGKQAAILRDLTAHPASSSWNNIESLLVTSNFNPKTAAILSLVAQRLEKGEQCVIVCARLGQSSALQRKLVEAGVRVARIDSTLSPDQHTAQANLFKQKKADVMLMGIKCANAHSFPQCWNLIIGSLEYTYGSFEQAVGRVYRVTTPNAVNIWCVLHRNSIEEIMFDTVATKGDAATICLQGRRVPRDYKPTDLSEVLAINFEQFMKGEIAGLPDEAECEAQWPAIKKALQLAMNPLAA